MTASNGGRAALAGVVALMTTVGGVAAQTAPASGGVHTSVGAAAATGCRPNVDPAPDVGDIDADGESDLVVGLPWADSELDLVAGQRSGAVDVHLSGRSSQRLTRATFAGTDVGQARFGSAMTVVDLDHDDCDDVLIGAPGELGGRVYVARGSRYGVVPDGYSVLASPHSTPGENFGAAVAASARTDGITDVWVGAPGATVDGLAGAGAVFHFAFDAAGAVTFVDEVSYSRPELGGVPHPGDRFGKYLAPLSDGVLVGVPRRTVSGKGAAGEVVFLREQGGPLTAQRFNQATPGVPGTAHGGDHFGAAVSVDADGSFAAVGVQSDDLRHPHVPNAGSVQTFIARGGVWRPRFHASQRTPGIPGIARRNNHFGAAVAVGRGDSCADGNGVAVGAPSDNVDGVKNAGSVTVISEGGNIACNPARRFVQGDGLPGHLERGDRVGTTLSTLRFRDFYDEDTFDTLLVGTPLENVGRDNAAGVVQKPCTTRALCAKATWHGTDGPRGYEQFGRTIAIPAAGIDLVEQ